MKNIKLVLIIAIFAVVNSFAQSSAEAKNKKCILYSVQNIISEYENIRKENNIPETSGIDTIHVLKVPGTFLAIDYNKKMVATNVKDFVATSDMDANLLGVQGINYLISFSPEKEKYVGSWTNSGKRMSSSMVKKK